jgi:predicted kinase
MQKVIILKGLPASGKSTWAKRLIDENPGRYKRVNKDDLRAMLDNGRWSKGNESLVLKIRDGIILAALMDGKSVIVDDTNLAPKHEEHIRELVKGKADVETKFFEATVKECIERDLKRPVSVGERVIRGMYDQFLKPKVEPITQDAGLPECVVCDIDGTIAKMNGRGPYDWGRVGEDEPKRDVIDAVMRAAEGRTLIFLSGRDRSCESETALWLRRHILPTLAGFDSFLYMRPAGDKRKDAIVKKEIFDEHIRGKYNVVCVSTTVTRWWRCGVNWA